MAPKIQFTATIAAFAYKPEEYRCLKTSDSQRMSNYFLQAVFKILSLMPMLKTYIEVETKAHDV